jgi:uncharacterized protein (DUF433 family)
MTMSRSNPAVPPEMLAFTSEQVSRLTGLSGQRLCAWARTGILVAAGQGERRARSRLYSFRDVIALRALAVLRGRASETEWRRLARSLERSAEPPSLSTLDLTVVANEVRCAIPNLRERTEAQLGRIERHRFVMRNASVVAGTRIPTSAIWNFHAAGYTTSAIIREYPNLTRRDVTAEIDFERRRHRRVAPRGRRYSRRATSSVRG